MLWPVTCSTGPVFCAVQASTLKAGSCDGARGRAGFAEPGWVSEGAALGLGWVVAAAVALLSVALAEDAGSAVVGAAGRALTVPALAGSA